MWLQVWCARGGTQLAALRGHRDEAYVLEAHPFLPGVLLSAGHDGQLFVWHAPHAAPLASFHNNIPGQVTPSRTPTIKHYSNVPPGYKTYLNDVPSAG